MAEYGAGSFEDTPQTPFNHPEEAGSYQPVPSSGRSDVEKWDSKRIAGKFGLDSQKIDQSMDMIGGRIGLEPKSERFALLVDLLRNGFERYHTKLGKSPEKKDLHNRLKAEFQSMGTIAALLKGITMNFCSRLHNYGHFFLHDDEEQNLIASGVFHLGFYTFAALNVLASFCMLTAILMSLINMCAVSLITTEQTAFYAQKAKFPIKLPFLALIYGILTWHVALGVLMCYMIGFIFGILFVVTCKAALLFVIVQYAMLIESVDTTWKALPGGIDPTADADDAAR